MIRDDLRREWEVADPVHAISRALLDHVIASQCNRESLFREQTLPSMTFWYGRYTKQCQGNTHWMPVYRCACVCARMCECVVSSLECLHECWFCSSKPFNSAFFFQNTLPPTLPSSPLPLFIATLLASTPFASIRHTHLFITSSSPAKNGIKALL